MTVTVMISRPRDCSIRVSKLFIIGFAARGSAARRVLSDAGLAHG